MTLVYFVSSDPAGSNVKLMQSNNGFIRRKSAKISNAPSVNRLNNLIYANA